MSELGSVIILTNFQGYPQVVVTLWITPHHWGPSSGLIPEVDPCSLAKHLLIKIHNSFI
jgi:hypothetical protein